MGLFDIVRRAAKTYTNDYSKSFGSISPQTGLAPSTTKSSTGGGGSWGGAPAVTNAFTDYYKTYTPMASQSAPTAPAAPTAPTGFNYSQTNTGYSSPSTANTAAPPASSGFSSTDPTVLAKIAEMNKQTYAQSSQAPESPTGTAGTSSIPTPASAGAAVNPANLKSLAQQNLERLQQQYLGTLTPSETERGLTSDLTNLRGSTALGVSGLEGQGRLIPLNLVRGQQSQLQEQGNIKAQTLEAQIANEIANRTAQGNVYGTQLGFETDRMNNEQQLQTSMLSAGYQPVDPSQVTDPNSVIQIGGQTFLKPSPESKVYEVGNNLVNEKGETIYQGAGSGESGLIEVGGSLYDPVTQQWITPPTAGGGAGGGAKNFIEVGDSLYDTTTGQWITNPNAPAGGVKVPASVKTDLAESQTLLDLIATIPATGPIPGVGILQGNLPGFMLSSGGQDARYTLNGILAQIAKLRGGTSFTENEQKLLESYTPKQGDVDEVIQGKIRNLASYLQTKIANIQEQFGGSTSIQNDPRYQQLKDAGYSDQEISEYLGFNSDLSTSQNGSIGSLSERYESGGNPGAIGYDTTGGYSYGTYQLAHNNAQSFISQSPYAQSFQGLTFNSPEWRARWQQVAKADPQGFGEAQKNYISKTHYEPQISKLAAAGYSNFSPTLQDVIWSTAVQHGGNTDVVLRALNKVGKSATDAQKIQAIYNERWGGGSQFASSTPAVQQSVYNRFFGPEGELRLALSQLGNTSNIG